MHAFSRRSATFVHLVRRDLASTWKLRQASDVVRQLDERIRCIGKSGYMSPEAIALEGPQSLVGQGTKEVAPTTPCAPRGRHPSGRAFVDDVAHRSEAMARLLEGLEDTIRAVGRQEGAVGMRQA